MLPPGLFHHAPPSAPTQGFSLVELLIVVGLLAGVTLPAHTCWGH